MKPLGKRLLLLALTLTLALSLSGCASVFSAR